ncbi:thiamine-phosphate kinase [Mycobacterium sp. MS1601]|uniref:thiamine-phosphate kinase n=1 Tax=Mycobacterium sp. MS1601 TaxID=1936029 RepID=UPI0009790A84|nr:thiamine-phosphate kinase [Mycobacterium sp. MS1601]AQA06004.1 thiamine-phosphate kinase [Mycobacterium sp. MS1601]
MGDEDGPTLAELGEFAVIERLTAGRSYPASVQLGPGDDAAVLAVPDGRVVVSTDMLVEGRHFRLDWSTPYDVGRKAIAQNAADVEAMGATATGFVVGLGAPAHAPARDALALADGMWAEAGLAGGPLIGGDLVSSPHWVVSVTVFGDLGGRAPVTRTGARPGAMVAVVGDLGVSAAGHAMWAAGVDDFAEFRSRHLSPVPPYGQGVVAAAAGATAMTDTSDGLVADLRHIAQGSKVDIDLSTEALRAEWSILGPAAGEVGIHPRDWVLGGGEDHALVACFPAEVPAGWRVIGRVLDGDGRVLLDGQDWAGPAGWESFGGG